MANSDHLIIKDDADKTPPAPAGAHPLRPISYADDTRRAVRLPAQAWVIITVAVLTLVLAFLVAVWRGFESLFLRWPWLSDAVLVALLGVFLIVVSGAAHGLYGWARAKAQHARIVRTRLGNPADVQQVLAMDPMAFELLASQLELAKAPFMQHANLSTLSYGGKQVEKAAEPLQLPEQQALGLIASSEWLGWIDQTPHLMIAGRTNAGKTTLATAVLSERVKANELLCVLDPHDQPGKWFGISAIGGGRDYEAIFAALAGILAEMDRRYERYNVGESSFERLTVLIDEVPAIVLHDKKRWAEFVSQLGSEARKVNMSMILLTQSPLVRDIEISSVMRNNFARVALGDQASSLLREESDRTRRQALDDLLAGQSHPAAMEYRMEIHLLDTSTVPTLATQRTPVARAWHPLTAPRKPTPHAVLEKAIREAKGRGWTREMARAAGLHFDNGLWSQITGERA